MRDNRKMTREEAEQLHDHVMSNDAMLTKVADGLVKDLDEPVGSDRTGLAEDARGDEYEAM